MGDHIQIAITMGTYMLVVIGIGLFYAKRANQNSEEYFLGGFLAESVSDFMQGVVMIVALIAIFVVSIAAGGGTAAVAENIRFIPGFFEFFGIASPQVVDGVQQLSNGLPLFGEAAPYGHLTIVSTMAWGLGYFGMPQVLLRFMAIRKAEELTASRRIATVWVIISMSAAVLIGVIGRVVYPDELLTSGQAENIFILLSTRLLPPMLAGLPWREFLPPPSAPRTPTC